MFPHVPYMSYTATDTYFDYFIFDVKSYIQLIKCERWGRNMLKEIVISNRIPIDAVLNGDVNTIIRISEKNKWKAGDIFDLKCSHREKESIKVIIVESTEQIAENISEEVLIKCYYKNREKFLQNWEKWYQRWESSAWVVKFGLLPPNPL
jgi:hypothetical protein